MAATALIALRNVNVHLGGLRALTDLTWQLREGQHWAFMGPNGSGKSTLLRVIRGEQWIDPDGGERVYRFDGRARGAAAGLANVGIVSPEQHERYARLVLPILGRNVVESGLDDSLYVHRPPTRAGACTVDEVIERLDLAAFVSEPVRSLSFGGLRRLLIARALVRRPRVLVLDEFTSGLDARSRTTVLALVESLAATVSLVIASHRDDDIVPAVTHHARLERGRLVASGAGRPNSRATVRLAARSTVASAAAVASAAHVASAASVPQRHDEREPLVTIAHADVYRGATLVLRDLTWSIERGQHTAISGENGSGKSTLAAVIAGTVSPAYGGEIRRSGNGGPFDVWRIKEHIAHLSEEWQIAYSVGHTANEVVLSGFTSSIGLFHVPDAAQIARAASVSDDLGIASLQARPFMQLSFGERRKVLIARALVRPPSLLILDEVWNGLDTAFRERFGLVLRQLSANGTTLVLIAHHVGDEPALIVRRQHLAGGTLRDA